MPDTARTREARGTTDIPIYGRPGVNLADRELLADAMLLRGALTDIIRVAQFRDRDRVCCYDVSVSQCYALEATVDDGASTVNDLAAHLYLDKSTASRLANSLVDKGYLRRVPNDQDRRSIVLEPTARARKLVERIKRDLAGEYMDILYELDADTRRSITRVVGRLATAFASRVETSGGSCCVIR
jgi:DNA-binding MarR family transcriptional regulator